MSEQNKIEELQKKIDSLSLENNMLKMSIAESEQLHQSVVEHSLDGTIIINKENQIVYANDEISNITKYDIDELIELNFLDIVSDSTRVSVKDQLTNLFKDSVDDYRFEIDIYNKEGLLRITLVSCSFVKEFQGQNSLIIQMLDITEIKEAEKRMLQINKELEQRVKDRTKKLEEAANELRVEVAVRKKAEDELREAKEEVQAALDKEKELNQLKTRFISMISHEYRTPLTVIMTSTYLVEQFYEGTKTEEFNKFLGKIRTSVDSMTKMLEEVLEIGKADSGKNQIIPQKMDILSLVNEVIEEIKVVDKDKHKFDLNFTLDDNVIISDEKSLIHILQNLIGNAAKYSPDSDLVKINIYDHKDTIEIQVIDEGIGIPKEDQEFLFQSFHRAQNVGTISGTGLGLAIVKRSVDAIDGKIAVDSKVGVGSKFILEIPKDIYYLVK